MPFARHSGRPDDALDTVTLAFEGPHRAVHLVMGLPTRPLHLLGRAEGLGIDVTAGDGPAKVAHVAVYTLDEGGSGILEQVPSIGDLHRLNGALGSNPHDNRGERSCLDPDRLQ